MDVVCETAWSHFQSQRSWEPATEKQADYILLKVIQALRPSSQELHARQAVIDRLNQVLAGMPDFQPRHGEQAGTGCLAQVLVFGSFWSGLYHKGSDLDLTITGRWRNRHGQLLDMHQMGPGDTADMLHRIKRALMARSVAAVDPRNPPMVINARVPLVMYTDAVSGVEVDVSVCNHGGVFKSRFVQQLVKFDERFEALYRLVKLWAEAHGLNDPKTGTLNSWSLTQMVVFHLQSRRPAVLPPLWLLFHSEPPQGPRPLERAQQQQQQQQQTTAPGSGQRQQQNTLRAVAPYSLLQTCEQQRLRYQPIYNGSSGGSGSNSSSSASSSEVCEQGLLELLVGFFVQFHEVLTQWLEYSRHRDLKMCTWLGKWHLGDALWQHDYLAAFEDPFDAADNTARTLGTAARHDGGCWKLQEQLARACSTSCQLRSRQDLDAVLLALFEVTADQALQPGFDPIAGMLQRQEEQQYRQAQQQPRQQYRPQQPLQQPPQQQQQQQPQQSDMKQLLVNLRLQQQTQQQQPQQWHGGAAAQRSPFLQDRHRRQHKHHREQQQNGFTGHPSPAANALAESEADLARVVEAAMRSIGSDLHRRHPQHADAAGNKLQHNQC